MSRSEKSIVVLLALVAVGLWITVAYKFNQAWQQPLGPPLALPTYTSTFAPEISETASLPRATAGPTNTMLPGVPTLTPYVAPTPNYPVCGGPPKMTLLAIGSDTRESGYLYGLADVIRLVRIDFSIPRVTVLEFPRDLWVEIPDIDNHYGITYGKLNETYFYGNKGMGYYKGQGEGPGLLARTLDLNFGAHPDHYVAGNMWTFVRVIDTIGGIDVYLPRNVDGRKPDQTTRSDLFFGAGPHHLNGTQTLMLARIRQNTVFERVEQQNWILCGVRKSLLQPQNLTKLPEIIDAFDGAVQTDLSPQQISQLACVLPKLNPQNITFVSFPTDLLVGDRTYDIGVQKDVFIWRANFDTLRLYVSAFDAGIWPTPKAILNSGAPSATKDPKDQSGFSCQ